MTSNCSRRSIRAYTHTALVKNQVVCLDDVVAQVCVFTSEILDRLYAQGYKEITRLKTRSHLPAMPEISEIPPTVHVQRTR